MTESIRELRHAFRRWRQRPAFAVSALLTLALGIGITTAIFSVVDGVLLRPLPWHDVGRLAVHAVAHTCVVALAPQRLPRLVVVVTVRPPRCSR